MDTTSSIQTRKLFRVFGPNVVVMATSAASRPRAINALPTRGVLFLGSNMCHIGLAVDHRTNRVTVISAIDNLGKGMVGQAIQNMNLMCRFEETAGLNVPGIWP